MTGLSNGDFPGQASVTNVTNTGTYIYESSSNVDDTETVG